MIVCHCNGITDTDIRAALDWMRAADARTIITPRKLYRALGKRPDCGGCLPLVLQMMRAHPGTAVPRADTPAKGAPPILREGHRA